ncbi:MAG: metallophosphoesterase [Verrucomicrobiota bacterium]
MYFVRFILLGIPFLSLFWWWWADRRLRRAGVLPRVALASGMLVLLGGFAWTVVGRMGDLEHEIPAWLYALVLLWGIIFLPFLAVPSMVSWALRMLGHQIVFRDDKNRRDPSRFWTRRRWLTTGLTTLPVLATYGTAAWSLPRLPNFRIRRITVSVPSLPNALDGTRIAHVTDTHVGKFTRGKVLDAIVAATNKLDADLVVFTGDLINDTSRDLPAATAMINRMRGRFGVFLIEGNHDLFDGAEVFEDGVRSAGIRMLRNESATVEIRGVAVQLLGIVWNHDEIKMAADVDTVAAMREPGAFPILMSHHPHAFEQAAQQGIPLTLAGHTHGGQLMLTPEFGAGSVMFRYWSGLYRKGSSSLVVSNGTGNWFPLRVNAPAEILEITLRRA